MRHRRWLWRLCWTVTLPFVPGVLPAADDYVSPPVIDGTRLVDAEDLIALVGKREDLVIIDARIREDRYEGYIEGSRHLVDRDTSCDSLAALLSRNNTPVAFYCNGINCDRSDRAVVVALGCGYSQIYWFRGGIEEWRDKNYPLIQ